MGNAELLGDKRYQIAFEVRELGGGEIKRYQQARPSVNRWAMDMCSLLKLFIKFPPIACIWQCYPVEWYPRQA